MALTVAWQANAFIIAIVVLAFAVRRRYAAAASAALLALIANVPALLRSEEWHPLATVAGEWTLVLVGSMVMLAYGRRWLALTLYLLLFLFVLINLAALYAGAASSDDSIPGIPIDLVALMAMLIVCEPALLAFAFGLSGRAFTPRRLHPAGL
jgi:hypothetical protein